MTHVQMILLTQMHRTRESPRFWSSVDEDNGSVAEEVRRPRTPAVKERNRRSFEKGFRSITGLTRHS